ncbi:hypothetical protein FGB62_10g04 [Gracilaria domingensis]|nr:hypothetical protein FGB62_10g04 [Gracilaria domingensis]
MALAGPRNRPQLHVASWRFSPCGARGRIEGYRRAIQAAVRVPGRSIAGRTAGECFVYLLCERRVSSIAARCRGQRGAGTATHEAPPAHTPQSPINGAAAHSARRRAVRPPRHARSDERVRAAAVVAPRAARRAAAGAPLRARAVPRALGAAAGRRRAGASRAASPPSPAALRAAAERRRAGGRRGRRRAVRVAPPRRGRPAGGRAPRRAKAPQRRAVGAPAASPGSLCCCA